MIVRPALETDAAALASLYGHHVLHGFGTFEETPPTAAQMEARRVAVTAHGLPWLVAEDTGRVVGFAYAGPFGARAGYRHTAEDSVYVAADALGRGIGRTLLASVLESCRAADLRQVVAVIGGSDNAASIGLHRALGFTPCGIGRGLGFKGGRWLDVVWMQKALNGGDGDLPTGSGLQLG